MRNKDKIYKKKKRVLGIIPARGGSKDLPGKNTAEFYGKPLIAWSIIASKNSHYITKTVVSSDNDDILRISESYGVSFIKRPKELAQDNSSSESVIIHVIDSLANQNEIYDDIILLQPTSPLRTSKDIDNAYELMSNSSADSLISVCKGDNRVLKFLKCQEDGWLEAISTNKYISMSRQDLPEVFKPNGAIYIINTDNFKKTQKFITDRTLSYEMSPNLSIDIDNKNDLEVAELEMALMQKSDSNHLS